jgi:hypothetical protein
VIVAVVVIVVVVSAAVMGEWGIEVVIIVFD